MKSRAFGSTFNGATLALTNPYDDDFYSEQGDGSYRSASIVVPILIDALKPRSVIDVGCGTGTWLHAFAEHGVDDFLGLDGDYVPRDKLRIPASRFQPGDLTDIAPVGRCFDLAISLEVAEHLPAESGEQFVSFLTSAADIVVFSAAIPNQGGTTHLNEQWQNHWAAKFANVGFSAYDFVRPAIWNNDDVEFWYRQNMITYAHQRAADALRLAERSRLAGPLDLVHPKLFQQRINEIPGFRKSVRGLQNALVSRIRRTPAAKS